MSEVTELQDHLKVLSKQVKLKEQVKRLLDNEDFKDVILTGFCKDEMARCMKLAVYDKISADQRDLYIQLAKSSAALDNYLNTLIILGNIAEEDMNEVQQQIEELLVNGEDE